MGALPQPEQAPEAVRGKAVGGEQDLGAVAPAGPFNAGKLCTPIRPTIALHCAAWA